VDKKRSQRLRGRKTWRANGAFENVEIAEKAVEATRKGEGLHGIFSQQRKELRLTQKPRKDVVQDIEEGYADGDKQVVQMNGRAGTNMKEKPTISA
jgi:hypothetical protein